jgi:hypothetical protein
MKMDDKERLGSIHLAESRVHWQAVVNMIMILK